MRLARLITSQAMSAEKATKLRLIDIGANLTDSTFTGVYHGSRKHVPDLDAVLDRAREAGVEKMIVTAGSLSDSRAAGELVSRYDALTCTVGCHPTRCSEFEAHEPGGADAYMEALVKETGGAKVVAYGEFGLDYDRLHFCPADTQRRYFELQLANLPASLPLFLHCRAAVDDFVEIVSRYRARFSNGVVHSFTGTIDELHRLLALDLYIGVNGCSLKTEENLAATREIPSSRLMLETDCPYCEIRPTHASHKLIAGFSKPSQCKKEKFVPGQQVKGRNEPANILQVLEAVAAVRGEDKFTLADVVYRNTMGVFFPNASLEA